MIIRKLEDIIKSKRAVHAKNGNWVSRRFLLKDDSMGFSMSDTIIYAGTETYIWYKYHLEAVYCIEGTGEVEDTETGEIHSIKPGVLYALDKHEKHYLRAFEDMRLICVFNPPLTGNEVHTDEGYYPLSG